MTRPLARFGQRSGNCRALVDTVLHGHKFDATKSQRELGLEYTALADTLVRTVQWYVDFGFVQRPLPNFPRLS